MSKGQITDVIQTRTDFEILKVDDHLQAGLQPFEKVEPDIRGTVLAQKMQPRIRDYLAELREQSNIISKARLQRQRPTLRRQRPPAGQFSPVSVLI